MIVQRCFFAFTLQHTTQTLMPLAGFFYILLYSIFYPYLCLCLDYPAFCLFVLRITHDTNIHAPGWIRTRNPSKRETTDLRLRVRDHRDSNPRPQPANRLQTRPTAGPLGPSHISPGYS